VKAPFAVLLAAGLALAPLGARAQSEPPVELTGTLAKARASGAVTIAHRESSIPFSYLNARKEPIGYSIELCKSLVEAIGVAVGKELEIKWLPVTSASRIEAIVSGKADLECGSTTNDIERRKVVAFSPTIFVSGTKLMVKRGSPIKSYRDLGGKTVVVTAGTTNHKAMEEIIRRFKVDLRIVVSPDHAQSFMQVVEGKADAFATDDVLLYGLIAGNFAQKNFDVVGEFLSYDPYGVMYRKGDAQLASVIHDSFVALAQDGEIDRQYKRWFLRKLPSGASIDLPMSPQLESIIQTLGGKTE